jgi:TonB family protein
MRGLYLMFALLALRATAQTPIETIEPHYSDEARLAGLEGTVQISFTVADDGTPSDLEVAKPLGLGLDETALETAKLWRFRAGADQPLHLMIGVEFLLPDKQSRWHLTRVAFDTPEGASRPVFLSVKYPLGSGLALDAGPSPIIDEARIVAAVGRQAWAVISFDVDENGIPRNFEAQDASADLWPNQAIALVNRWRFTPGMKDGKPVSARCTLELLWGQRNLSAAQLAHVLPAEAKPEAQVQPLSPPPVSIVTFPPPPAGVERIALSASAQFDNLIKRVAPKFPPTPGQTGMGGVILFEVLIGTDGHVQQAFPVSQDSAFIPEATEALMQWVYRPPTLNGQPAEVTTTVPIEVPSPKNPPK